jgi:glycerol-3-phosphate dehydrogenase
MIYENMPRAKQIEKLKKTQFDCLIIGGGATGAGAALDAALRGLTVAVIDNKDFSAGTSSRSTKLIHGGIRYLGQFRFKLIKEALSERKRLLNNAPHLVKPLKFVLPTYKFYEKSYYTIGLTMYDMLAGDSGVPYHKRINKEEALQNFPSLKTDKLKGGIIYYDAQFNDSRLNVYLVRSAEKEGATVCNRIELESFNKKDGKLESAILKDLLTGETFEVKARVFVNTTGVFVDEIRKKDDPNCKKVLSPSQGIHLVFSKDKIKCNSAMIIPKTSDGRVVFLIPWEDHVIMGTTDTSIQKIDFEPMPIGDEVDFLLKTGNEYLSTRLVKSDVLSVFVGLRPLISPEGVTDTKKISREEEILVSGSGLITMSGGKWSTYRKMAEDLVNKVIADGKLDEIKQCSTYDYPIIGSEDYSENLYLKLSQKYSIEAEAAKRLRNYYGGEVFTILGEKPKELIEEKAYYIEEVKHFIKNEYALTILDVLARRFRVLFLDLNFASKLVKPVSDIMSIALGWSAEEKEKQEAEANALIQSLRGSL